MNKSPCKECEDHETKFPKCIKTCKTLTEFQNKYCSTQAFSSKRDYVDDELSLNMS